MGLRAPRKITVEQKSATVGTCSAHESHVLVRVRNWIFRGALNRVGSNTEISSGFKQVF